MISTNFSTDLKEILKYKTNEVKALKDQLTLLDVKIDQYDVIIQNIDKLIIPAANEINSSIDAVKVAYDNRIAVKCKTNLYWEKSVEKLYDFGNVPWLSSLYADNPKFQKTVYTCKKNPSLKVDYGYYGVKYYRKPQNQDYGANVVRDFFGTIKDGSTILAVFGLQGTDNLSLGDKIVDNIDNPIVFSSTNIPSIIAFGSTTFAGVTSVFAGSVSYGSTIIANVGNASTSSVNIGDSITFQDILNPSTTIVGFGTTTITLDGVWDPGTGTFISTTSVTDSLIISIPAIGFGTTDFNVGPLITYPALILSEPAQTNANNTNFTCIRDTQTESLVFDYSNNGIDPVTVGIINQSSIGYGDRLVKVKEVNPPGPFQWREVITSSFAGKEYSQLNDGEKYLRDTYPEPQCGAGWAEYYTGSDSWPIKIENFYDEEGRLISSRSFYAQEGDQVVIAGLALTTIIPVGIGYTPHRPSGTPSDSDCNNIYTAAIISAEQHRDAMISKNEPVIDLSISQSATLRTLRDTFESRAFATLQGRLHAEVEINNLKKNIGSLESTDYTPYEPKNYYYNSKNGKFNSFTPGG